MPAFQLPGFHLEIPRGSLLLDSNVLVAGFDRNDRYFESARYFLQEAPDLFLVPFAVVVETWGMLVGSIKDKRSGLEFIRWVRTPGKVEIIPQPSGDVKRIDDLVTMDRIDCVDGLIVELVAELARQFGAGPNVKIATYDTADFVRCMQRRGIQIDIQDMREWA